ncbi:MAG: nucleotidyltransferase domain-containing protein [Spirochaetaceae bacterium]|nr:nucleotidyltransferase domain-containing protein [Spirochaetaceae bacterium]
MQSGISTVEKQILRDILSEYMQDFSFYCYGSRVKGTHSAVSDLDVLIKGEKEMPLCSLCTLKESIDESDLPYIVNFTDYHLIDQEFYNLIKDDLVLIE